MIDALVRITLSPVLEAARNTPSFIGFVTRLDADGVAADGRWELRHGGLLREQPLARPWSHIERIERLPV